MSKSRKRFEEDMHEELGPEPMCNMLHPTYAERSIWL